MKDKIPFNFYDHIAVVFPGSILLGIFLYYYPELFSIIIIIKDTSTTLLIFIFIILSFICGHVTYSISKAVTDFINKIFKINTDKFKELSDEKQDRIINIVETTHGTNYNLRGKIKEYRKGKINGQELDIKNLCFAPVKEDVSNHYMFVSLADFQRSIAFLLGLIFIGTIMEVIILKNITFDKIRDIILICLLGLSAILMYKRSVKMRKTADGVVYSQFLFQYSKK